MKVKDIPNDFIFVSDSQEVKAIAANENIDLRFHGIQAFFVRIDEGDYTDIYGITGIVPWLERPVIPFKQTWISEPIES